MCEHHDWQPTGKQAVHVDFPTKTKGRKICFAVYLRCRVCKQMAFRKPYSRVIYTWQGDNTEET